MLYSKNIIFKYLLYITRFYHLFHLKMFIEYLEILSFFVGFQDFGFLK